MKTALVTGASGGIGKAIAKKFILNGYFTVCHYNSDEQGIINFKNELIKENLIDYAYFCKADFSKTTEIKKLFYNSINQFGHIDVLVNNAGADLIKQINDTDENDFDKLFSINVKAPYILSSLCVNKMIERKFGNIIFVSSVWGSCGASMETLYSSTKASLIGLGKALAKEVAPSGIRVNVVCPGVVDTKMNNCFSEIEKKEIIEKIPLNKMCKPEEIAELIYFICSEKSNYITGQTFTIDGGYTL